MLKGEATNMATKAIEEAFQRHPRPQVPTKAALLQKALEKSKLISTAHREIYDSPWKTLARQGNLVQGKYVWSICVYERQLVLIKETPIQTGRDELEKVKKLSNHLHVSTIIQAFQTETSLFLQLEYSRYTLEEVLNVHICLEELHIRMIASSVSMFKYTCYMIVAEPSRSSLR